MYVRYTGVIFTLLTLVARPTVRAHSVYRLCTIFPSLPPSLPFSPPHTSTGALSTLPTYREVYTIHGLQRR